MEKEFKFREIKLQKDRALGRGAYGSVCKAKCDNLTCAAKIIHSILFDFNDLGVRSVMKRFELECQLLSAINHPNIVQYLGTHIDTDTGLPVLLMELMDESLTKFLEKLADPLAYHTQVNFSHDIMLALAYLHSNSILHRDLSSNNILLIGERRVKVTDFGMSQLERVNPRISTATMCPGTQAYMSPEALKEKPLHTEMVDIFSLGVLIVQIITRKFPEPTERFETLYVTNPKDSRHKIEVQAPIKETERRRNHLSLIEDGHPLLGVSLQCLNDSHTDRPSAHELATILEEQKTTNAYRDCADVTYKARYYKLKQEFDQVVLDGRSREKKHDDRDHEISKEFDCVEIDDGKACEAGGHDSKVEGKIHKAGDHEEFDRVGYESSQSEAHARIEELEKEIKEEKAKHKEEIEMYKRWIKDKNYIIQEKDRIIRAQGEKITQSKDFSLRWRKEQNAPVHFTEGGHSAVAGEMTYFKRLNSNKICQFDTDGEVWSILPDPPVKTEFALTSIHNFFLTTVGGKNNSKGKLYTYVGPGGDRKWVERFPPMGSTCLQPSVTCTESSVIAFSFDETYTRTLSGYVLDLLTLQWSSFQPEFTNQYHHSASVFTSNRVLYFAGGLDMYGSTSCFYACPLNNITNPKAWSSKRRLRNYHSTVVDFRGHVLSFGGSPNHTQTPEDEKVKTIYKYDPNSDHWTVYDEMDSPRSNCVIAVVGDRLVVVVGNEPSADGVSSTSIAKIV